MKELLVDYCTFELTPKQINEAQSRDDGRVIVTGVLQRAEAENHNGRVYRPGVKGTPSGNILKSLLHHGIKLGISSRGMGSVKELREGQLEVQDDFELICWDFVSNPSTHGAFMSPSGGVNEGLIKEGINNKTKNKYANVEKIITEIICETKGFCPCIPGAKNGKKK